MSLDDNRIVAAAHRCLMCEKALKDRDKIRSAYYQKDLVSFEKQVELGIIGSNVRSFWIHVDCANPALEGFNLNPDVHHCIKCSKSLAKEDVVTPVFQVIDPDAVNPEDPTDKGIALNERVYFIHADCVYPSLSGRSNILV
jgi:hypothetical protein